MGTTTHITRNLHLKKMFYCSSGCELWLLVGSGLLMWLWLWFNNFNNFFFTKLEAMSVIFFKKNWSAFILLIVIINLFMLKRLSYFLCVSGYSLCCRLSSMLEELSESFLWTYLLSWSKSIYKRHFHRKGI